MRGGSSPPPPPPQCPPQQPTPLSPHHGLVGSLRLNISHRSFASTETRAHRICAPFPRLVGLRTRKDKWIYLLFFTCLASRTVHRDCAPFSVVSASTSPGWGPCGVSGVRGGIVRSPPRIVFGEVRPRSRPHGSSTGCTNSWITRRGKHGHGTRQGM